MSSIVKYGIEHPIKGLLGFSNGEPVYPNENNPNEVDLDNTSLHSERGIQDDRLAKSTLLQQEGCVVVPVTISCTIGITEPLEMAKS
ncbi:MAG: hypothetical protein JWM92_313 [Candidatus Nomurabacteria bacterium]|jgi:hypothetical protein|nr:hypothetical protein [Candidatus Nomurabacteria bacterium]